jgi:hypothetical protein
MTVGTGTVNPDYIIGNDTLVVVSPQAAQINAVQRKESGFAIRNEDPPNETAHYDYVSDVNYINEMDWEERYAKVIHDYLAGADGQAALKKLKGGWALATPKCVMKFTDADGKAFAWKRVFMKENAKEWTDLTDGDGKIHIYQGDPAVIQICPQKNEDILRAPNWLPCGNGNLEGITITRT